jgi:hypothetical protein
MRCAVHHEKCTLHVFFVTKPAKESNTKYIGLALVTLARVRH